MEQPTDDDPRRFCVCVGCSSSNRGPVHRTPVQMCSTLLYSGCMQQGTTALTKTLQDDSRTDAAAALRLHGSQPTPKVYYISAGRAKFFCAAIFFLASPALMDTNACNIKGAPSSASPFTCSAVSVFICNYEYFLTIAYSSCSHRSISSDTGVTATWQNWYQQCSLRSGSQRDSREGQQQAPRSFDVVEERRRRQQKLLDQRPHRRQQQQQQGSSSDMFSEREQQQQTHGRRSKLQYYSKRLKRATWIPRSSSSRHEQRFNVSKRQSFVRVYMCPSAATSERGCREEHYVYVNESRHGRINSGNFFDDDERLYKGHIATPEFLSHFKCQIAYTQAEGQEKKHMGPLLPVETARIRKKKKQQLRRQ
ncbi:unnamed protein product [Rangifer tarandus platyrhynchus]|uniref:Uncharacterized protein n=1 Tax=Rangifer tarandus platyrhynchus TaxID=3082113 RepID=A0ABN8XIJ9_RANTA|nr:unnamed protein product [Rangifer tarandus platyrhynchus]